MYDIIFSVYVYGFIIYFLLQPVFVILNLTKYIPYFYACAYILSFINPIKFQNFKKLMNKQCF